MKRITFALIIAAACSAFAQATPIPVITLIPASGDVSGRPGAVVGWGFDVTYSAASDWLVLTGSEFTGSPIYGTYVDYLSLPTAPLYVAGPSPESSTISQTWNPSSNPPLGVGEFDINLTAPVGATITGDIVVHYSVFSQDPNSPTFDPSSVVIPDATVDVLAQVAVSPEPSSFWLVSAVFVSFVLLRWRRYIAVFRP